MIMQTCDFETQLLEGDATAAVIAELRVAHNIRSATVYVGVNHTQTVCHVVHYSDVVKTVTVKVHLQC